MASQSNEITQLLRAWSAGDKSVPDKLIPLVYDDLRKVARRRMALERQNHTLQPTALVHEVYVRLIDGKHATLNDRVHFFAMCARLMREILVDAERARRAAKRGGDLTKVDLDGGVTATTQSAVALIAVDDALKALKAFDPRKSEVLEMRIFAGLSVKETAQALGISEDTVTRDMQIAGAWLKRELGQEDQRETRPLA